MARGFIRRRRYSRRVIRRGRKSRASRRRMLMRMRVKRFVNKMGYPSYVKMIGMTESKKLLLRKTLTLSAPYSTKNGNPATNVFQIVLNPLECPNINKAFKDMTIGIDDGISPVKMFKYDYIRIKSIFISIKPAQSISSNNGTVANGENNFYSSNGDSPISNVYAYFTYKFPMLDSKDDLENENIKAMYSTNPLADRIIEEGKLKNTYSWPCNKPMTISLNRLYYRVNNEPYRLCSNSPLDLQYLTTLDEGKVGVYDPFNFKNDKNLQGVEEFKEDNDNDNYNDNDTVERGDPIIPGDLNIPDMESSKDYNLFFGRLVIVAPKQVRFTTEICYDCVLLR